MKYRICWQKRDRSKDGVFYGLPVFEFEHEVLKQIKTFNLKYPEYFHFHQEIEDKDIKKSYQEWIEFQNSLEYAYCNISDFLKLSVSYYQTCFEKTNSRQFFELEEDKRKLTSCFNKILNSLNYIEKYDFLEEDTFSKYKSFVEKCIEFCGDFK